MKTVAFYFHGYGSSHKTYKVQLLKDMGYDTYSFPIDIDIEASKEYLMEEIDYVLMDYLHEDIRFVFIGTSLGAYYASMMGDLYNIETILINPSYNPKTSLLKYGVSPELCDKYTETVINENDHVVIALDDAVIDHKNKDFSLAKSVKYYETGGHMFTGEHFVSAVKEILE